MSKIQIKFVCPTCNNGILSELVLGGGNRIYNEMESIAKKTKDKDENKYFCWRCLVAIEPKLIDFALKDEKHA